MNDGGDMIFPCILPYLNEGCGVKFRNDINGLRAIAVIAVVLFHVDNNLLKGGFAGVDVFFVISGFLMTGIIFSKFNSNDFSIISFYSARAKRVIPPLMFLCFMLLIYGWFYLTPVDYQILNTHIASSLSFISNVVYWQESGYFAADATDKLLLHTWSLSAEWQFYMIYPLVIMALSKYLTIEHISRLIVVATVLFFLISVYSSVRWPSMSYFMLPTRAWEMLMGGIAYLYPIRLSSEVKKDFLSKLGVIIIVISYFIIDKDNIWPGWLASMPVFGAYLVLIASSSKGFLSNSKFLNKIGLYSYSIYLWHWPLIVIFYERELTSEFYKALLVVLSITVGYLSYKRIEINRFMKFKRITISFFVLLISSIIIIETDGFNYDIRSVTSSERAQYLSKYPVGSINTIFSKEYRAECNFYDVHSKTSKKEISESCLNFNKFQNALLWGDSHAQALSYGLRKIIDSNMSLSQVATSNCKPAIDNSAALNELSLACEKSNQLVKSLILDKAIDVLIITESSHDPSRYNEISLFVQTYSPDTKLIIVGPVPQWEIPLPRVIAKRHFDKNVVMFHDKSSKDNIFEIDEEMLSNMEITVSENVNYISIINEICVDKKCLAKVDTNNTPLLWDKGHLTLEGSQYISKEILKEHI